MEVMQGLGVIGMTNCGVWGGEMEMKEEGDGKKDGEEALRSHLGELG